MSTKTPANEERKLLERLRGKLAVQRASAIVDAGCHFANTEGPEDDAPMAEAASVLDCEFRMLQRMRKSESEGFKPAPPPTCAGNAAVAEPAAEAASSSMSTGTASVSSAAANKPAPWDPPKVRKRGIAMVASESQAEAASSKKPKHPAELFSNKPKHPAELFSNKPKHPAENFSNKVDNKVIEVLPEEPMEHEAVDFDPYTAAVNKRLTGQEKPKKPVQTQFTYGSYAECRFRQFNGGKKPPENLFG